MQQSIFCWYRVLLIAMSFPIKQHVEDCDVNRAETAPHALAFFPTYVDKVCTLKVL